MKTTAFLGVLVAMSLAPLGVQAEPGYPKRTITIVVGYGAGGGTDVCNRVLAMNVGKKLGQTVIIENKPGAGSALAIAYLARQKPDGYTLASLSTGAVLNQVLMPQPNYDVVKGLTSIAMLAQYQVGLLVRADSKFKTLDDIIKAAQSSAKPLAYSTAGIGTPQHLTTVRLADKAKANWLHSPYKSGPEAIMALLRGEVDFMSQTAEWVPYVRDGRLRLITVFTDERMKGFEQAPTLRELGHDLVAPSILGIVGPAKMPADIVTPLQDALQAAMQTKEFHDCAENFGLRPDFKDSATFNTFLGSTLKEWEPLLKTMADK
jgi:tripartite-type tricarboxylate transporter receptor subunit TctC